MAEEQRGLLGGDAWIVDGNYHETLDLRLRRADTVVFLDMPWPVCAGRAFWRGLRKAVGELSGGCHDPAWRRLRDEWRLALSSGASAARSPSANTRSFRSTGSTRTFTCSGPNGQLRSSSTRWTSRTRKPSTRRRSLSAQKQHCAAVTMTMCAAAPIASASG